MLLMFSNERTSARGSVAAMTMSASLPLSIVPRRASQPRHCAATFVVATIASIGMSPMEAIVATTKVAAQCLGWEARLGTIDKGKLADIVIAATDPLADVRSLENISNIKLVMKDGQVVEDIR